MLAAAWCVSASGADLEWSHLDPLPAGATVTGAYVAEIDGRLVLAGGLDPAGGASTSDSWIASASVWVLDAPDAQWRATTPLPEPTAFGAAASAGSFAVFAGGTAAADTPYRDAVYRAYFDGEDLAYEELPSLPGPRAFASGAMLDGVIYFAGGFRDAGTGQPSEELLRFDPNLIEEGWTVTPALPSAPLVTPGLAVQEGALYLFGGNSLDGNGAASGTFKFVPGTGWSPLTDGPVGPLRTAVPLGPTHVALMSFGSNATPVPSAAASDLQRIPLQVMAYHTVTDTWTPVGGDVPSDARQPISAGWGDMLLAAGASNDAGDSRTPLLAARLVSAPSGFSKLDYAALAVYLSALVLMGFYFARQGSSTEDFFLAGRSMPWWATGLSIFGTQLSSISFMAVPAKVYATDWVYFLLQMTIVMIAFPVVFFYLPYFRRVKMTSAYEYLESRFNLPVRMYASVSFVLYQLGRMAIVLFLPAIALSTVTGISVHACILTMGILSTLYTVMGGMKAVIWTDVVQVFVLYGGALLSLGILLANVDGGLSGLVSAGIEYDKFHMFNWTWDWTTTAVWVVLVGNLFLNLVPYTSDQAVVQRYFTTKDEATAARSIWTNAILIVPSTLTLFLLGTGLWAFYRANPELLNPALPTDSIFPLFIAQQLPTGVAGLLIAAVFAASMSTLDSSLNSVSAALVTDFYVRFRPRSSDRSRLALARVLTAGLGALATATSIALATFDIGSLWDTFQGMMGLLGGGLAGLFALGIFFPRANGAGAMTGAVSSVVVLYWVQQHSDLHFFLYGAIGVLSCVGVGIVASGFLGRSAPST